MFIFMSLIKFGKFSAVNLQIFLLLLSVSLLLRLPYSTLNGVPQVPIHFLFFFFLLLRLDTFNCLIFTFAVSFVCISNTLWNTCSGFFILVILFFTSRISIWFLFTIVSFLYIVSWFPLVLCPYFPLILWVCLKLLF